MVMRVLTDAEKQAIKEELQTLESNIEKVANILANKKTPYAVGINAEKLLSILIKIKNYLLDRDANNKLSIIQRLPLLYLQIHKLGVQNVK